MEEVLSKFDKDKREIQVKRTTSTNAIAIKGMLKEIILQAA